MILNYRAIRIGVLTIVAFAAGSTFGQTAATTPCLNRIGQKEWAVLLKDLDPAKKKLLQDLGISGNKATAHSRHIAPLGQTGERDEVPEIGNA